MDTSACTPDRDRLDGDVSVAVFGDGLRHAFLAENFARGCDSAQGGAGRGGNRRSCFAKNPPTDDSTSNASSGRGASRGTGDAALASDGGVLRGFRPAVELAGAFRVVWLCWGAASAWRIGRGAKAAVPPLEGELTRIVPIGGPWPRLLVSPRVANAVALGVLRPTIVLPDDLAAKGPSPELRAVLMHECAHLAHRDLWLLALGRCLLPILFAHPLFWWLRRAIRVDQEILADAVAAGENRHDYAETLLNLIRNTVRPSPVSVSAAIGIWEGPTQLSRRITMLLDDTFRIHTTGSRRWKLQAFGLMLLLGAACSLLTFTPARSAEDKGKKDDPAAVRTGFGRLEIVNDSENSSAERSGSNATGNGNVIKSVIRSADGAGSEGVIRSVIRESTTAEDGETPDGSNRFSGTTWIFNASPFDRELLAMPGFEMVNSVKVISELKLTAEQKNTLKTIREKFFAELPKLNLELAAGSKNASEKKAAVKAYGIKMQELQKDIAKQVSQVFTPEQSKMVAEVRLAYLAAWGALRAEPFEDSGIDDLTESQKKEFLKLQTVRQAEDEKGAKECKANMFAVFDVKKRSILVALLLGTHPEGIVQNSQKIVRREKPKCSLAVPDSYPFPDFSAAETQKALNLTESQQKLVKEMLGGCESLTEKLAQEMEKLPVKDQNRVDESQMGTLQISSSSTITVSNSGTWEPVEKDIEKLVKKRVEERQAWEKQPIVKMSIELRKKFEASLSPEQRMKYELMAFDSIGFYQMFDPTILYQIGATEAEKESLEKISAQSNEKHQQEQLEFGKKALKELTSPQKDKLRKMLDRDAMGVWRMDAESVISEGEPQDGVLSIQTVSPKGDNVREKDKTEQPEEKGKSSGKLQLNGGILEG
jgi:hypothetical protein